MNIKMSTVRLSLFFLFCVTSTKARLNILCPENLGQWGIDIFKLDAETSNHSLVTVCYCALKSRHLIETFNLNETKVLNYLELLENGYKPIPYHNHIHAADVTQTVHAILSFNTLRSTFNDLEILAILFAAAGHDVEHPGLGNSYLSKTGHPWALQAKNESVLEYHHQNVTLSLMENPEANAISTLSSDQQNIFRTIVKETILATDMAKHGSLTKQFIAFVDGKNNSGAIKFDNFQDKLFLLKIILHLSDISTPTKSTEIFRQWTDRVMEEFFAQGDLERKQGLKISPMCDRFNTSIPLSQIAFMNGAVRPLLEPFVKLVGIDAKFMLDQLNGNVEWYKNKISANDGYVLSFSFSDWKIICILIFIFL